MKDPNDHSSKSTASLKSAVGLKYDQSIDEQAPTLIAKGFGDLAEEIIALAEQHGVLIHEDPNLNEFLMQLDLGQEIPETLYHVIAELIAFSYILEGKYPDSWARQHGKVSKEV
jgi:flagellar biosynthesis protein